MKIDRLIGIITVLLQKGDATAPFLAKRFEVSRRTINRDIEDLCKAGIPIVTRQGINGGISIMDNFKLNKALLTNSEMQDILLGLRSLDSVNNTNRYGQLMEKLSIGSSDFLSANQSILIDLSAWQKDSLAPKIELIRSAMEKQTEIEFIYYGPNGDGKRQVEPYYLIFRWSHWYVWGWCALREDFRMFKLNRIEELRLTEKTFSRKDDVFPDLSNERIFPTKFKVKALFDPDCKWRVIEEYGVNSFEVQPDGKLFFSMEFTDKEYFLDWFLAFREKAELIEPDEIREEIKNSLEKMKKRYK